MLARHFSCLQHRSNISYLLYFKCTSFFRRGSGEDVRLTVELTIPTSQIGRIIGKGGASVRELQKITGANVKFPEQPQGGNQQQTAWLPDGYSRILRSYVFGPPGFKDHGSATLRCKI